MIYERRHNVDKKNVHESIEFGISGKNLRRSPVSSSTKV